MQNRIWFAAALAVLLLLSACSGKQATEQPADLGTISAKPNTADVKQESPAAEETKPENGETAESGASDYGSFPVGEGVLKLTTVTADPLYDGKFSGYSEADGWVLLVFEPTGGRITYGDISDFSKCLRIDGCEFENMSGTLGEEGPISELSNLAISSEAGVYCLFDAPADFTFSAELLHVDPAPGE